ncbi:MAG: hypothetical protein B9S27_06645 [Opitutia bacterium Tous-C8FEB]|jgi:hypothetical protein|nr:MAG: hypothetical protein B9S27_06645 [Opitutae bacterium Tous-C8FEB]
MTTLISSLLVLAAAASVVTYFAVIRARDGHEDERGFHAGSRPRRRAGSRPHPRAARSRRHRLPAAA